MEFYLNNIYFGNGYYGIQSASRGYFNRDVQELSMSEIAFLCAIPNNPSRYDPVTNKDNTLERRDRILKNMLDDEKISNGAYQSALKETIVLERPVSYAKNNSVETYVYFCATEALMEQNGFQFQYDFPLTQRRKHTKSLTQRATASARRSFIPKVIRFTRQ